jgi:predicted SprT family Zn-dependent metalloprotease
MNLSDAKTLAIRLMEQHDLRNMENFGTPCGIGYWSFAWNNRRRGFGLCRYDCRQIELSCHLVALNSETEVRDTILHEIAHALAGPRAGHGRLWQIQAHAIGCNAERCYSTDSVKTPMGKYVSTCPGCGRVRSRFRRPRAGRKYSCGVCAPGRFDERFLLNWEVR